MGNEASLEGEGPAEGEDGQGEPPAIPAGLEADLGRLSEDERRQIAAVMSRAKGLPKGSLPVATPQELPPLQRRPELDLSHHPKQLGKPPDPGPPRQPSLSKSRTTDTFKTEQKSPGRSPSTISLRESKSRTDLKEDQKTSMMPSFLTESNPLSAVSSVVNKFNPFDLISDSEASQEDVARRQKAAQKEQGKPEGTSKPMSQQSQQQSPKPSPKMQGPSKTGPQLADSTKSAAQPAGKSRPHTPVPGKEAQGHGQEAAPQMEQAKQPLQQRGPLKSQPQHPDLTKPGPAKPSSQPPVPTKPSLHPSPGPAKPPPQPSPGPAKPPPHPTPVPAKTPVQPSLGPTRSLHQPSPGPTKLPPQPSTGPVKPTPQPSLDPAKPSPQPSPGPMKPSPQPSAGPVKPTPQQLVDPKPTPQPSLGPARPPTQRPGDPTKPPPQPSPVPAKPPPQPLVGPKKPSSQLSAGPTKSPSQPSVGPAKPRPELLTKPSSQQVASGKPLPPTTASSSAPGPVAELGPSKTFCPLCTTTELLLHTPEKANYNCCTQCQTTVCSLCGFNPNPHITEIKEWLCLNCQMQRALGGSLAAAPPPPQPKPKTAPPAPLTSATKPGPQLPSQKKDGAPIPDHPKPPETKKPSLLTKQPSISGSPPTKAKPRHPDSGTPSTPPTGTSSKAEQFRAPMADVKLKPSKPQKTPADVVAPSIAVIKSDLPGSKVQPQAQEKIGQAAKPDPAKPPQSIPPLLDKEMLRDSKSRPPLTSDSKPVSQPGPVSGSKGQKPVDPVLKKEDPKKAQTKMSPKPDAKQVPKGPPAPIAPKPGPVLPGPGPQQPPKAQEQTRRFSLNLGSVTDAPKPQPTTPQETVTGKLFGFGASIFSQASNLISTAGQPGPQGLSGPGAPEAKQPFPPSQTPTSQGPPRATPVKKEMKALPGADRVTLPKVGQVSKAKGMEPERRSPPTQDSKPQTAEPRQSFGPPTAEKPTQPQPTCPLCKTGLNVGSKDSPNFNTCTECKKVVCNLCGFNPTPHITEVEEWLCLNCQTQRAISGQLGKEDKMPLSLPSIPAQPVPKSPAGPPSEPLLTEQPFLKMPVLPPYAVETKKEQEAQKEVFKVAQEEVTKIPSLEKLGSKENTDQKPEKSKLERDKMADSEDKKPPSQEGQKQDISQLKEQIVEEKPKDTGPPEKEEVDRQPQVKTEDLPSVIPQSTSKDEKTQHEETQAQGTPLQRSDQVELVKEKTEKEDDKSEASSSQQQKSPQGLSDTGYSSDGISSSLGEIPSLIPCDEKDFLKGLKKDSFSQESSPSSPSDLAKLESTVLSILEAQASTFVSEKPEKKADLCGVLIEPSKELQKTKLSLGPLESFSSDEEDLQDGQEPGGAHVTEGKPSTPLKSPKERTDSQEEVSEKKQRYDSVEDSSESENSPVPQRKRRASVGSSSSDEYKQEDSQGSGDDEDFIRKQIIEMSADEDASGSEDEEFIRKQLKEIGGSQKKEEAKAKIKGTAGKHRRMTRKSSASFDDDAGRRHSWHDEDDETFDESPEPKYRETKSQESEELSVSGGGGLRRFKTIELNSTMAVKYSEELVQKKAILYFDEEPELEMESLTDSPEDRSRGEGSSSLHASSFTPGTSPTSVSSLDEDSDSSPSQKKGESKQQRKARHRTHGPLLPTIEDSSEEEEMREEEELLKEQEKQRELEQQQRKSSSKKSKKDKDELRAQRRRERPKTPPSNLSPIEDASPTEELRQAAEMEELHRSSCSEYSPSIESDPEGFEISPEKIIEVQKVYKLPTAVSLYSPTDEPSFTVLKEEGSQKALKSAEEMYEEMMHKSQKSKAIEKEDIFEKEPLYGGMLIEDYIYESLVEDTYDGSGEGGLVARPEEENEFIQQRNRERKLRLPEQIYEESMQKISDLQKEFYDLETLHSIVPQEDIVSSSYIIPESHEIIVLGGMVPSTSEEKRLLDADAAYEELMKRQQMQLSLESSPVQPASEMEAIKSALDLDKMPDTSLTSSILSAASLTDSTSSTTLSIPDVKITQHFSAEEIENEYVTDYTREIQEIISHESSILTYSEQSESAASALLSDTPSLTSSISSVSTTDSSSPIAAQDTIVSVYAESVDQVAPLGDSEETPSLSHFPVLGIKDSEKVVSMDESALLLVRTSGDSTVIPLSQGATGVTMPVPMKPMPFILDSVSVDPLASEIGPARKPKDGNGISLAAYQEKSRENGSRMPRIGLADSLLDQTLPCAAPAVVREQLPSIPSAAVPRLPSLIPLIPPISSKVAPLLRSSSLDSPIPSPLPPPPPPPPPPLPPILPKPAIYPKKKPPAIMTPVTITTTAVSSVASIVTIDAPPVLKNNVTHVTKTCTPSPPPVPPKPSSIPSGLVFTHRPTEGAKPPIAPKPAIPQLPVTAQRPAEMHPKPTALPFTASMTLNLVSSADYKLPSPTSPLSPHSNKSSPRLSKSLQETYVVITLPSEPGTPTDVLPGQAIISWPVVSPAKELASTEPVFSIVPSVTPVDSLHLIDHQVYPSRDLDGLSALSVTVPSVFQAAPSSEMPFVTADITKTVVSGTDGTTSTTVLDSVSITIPTEPLPVEKHRFDDVIDLRTLSKMDGERTDSCMDLSASPLDVRKQTTSGNAYVRQVSAIQPAIINLSSTLPVAPPSPLVPESIKAKPCTTSPQYSTSTESLVGLVQSTSTPLQLTPKRTEPAYRLTSSQVFFTPKEEVPINLSLGPSAHTVTRSAIEPVSAAPMGVTNGWADVSPLDGGAVDLSTTKTHRTMVTMDESTRGVVTTVIEDDDKPVDLTAGRKAVCCDVVYKLPFGRSCTAQQPATTLPEDRFGYRDDHYQYDRSGAYGSRGIGGMKPSMSDTNLAEAGLFMYKSKNAFDYAAGIDAAVDLTSGRITTGEVMDYSNKTTGTYPETRQVISGIGIGAPQYSTARMTPPLGTQYGMGSVLRSSNGVVYSSVATPIPSTFAITTQPGSIFSTTVRDLSGVPGSDAVTSLSALRQSQPLPRTYSFLTTGASDKEGTVGPVAIDTSLRVPALESLTSVPGEVIPTLTSASEVFPEVLEGESALIIVPEEDKQQQLDLERELLELEKIKQQRFAEELEWERQEIQRFREQEKFMVQKKLEELQSMKQHLLYQQEEERQAQYMMRQETLAQQQLQLEQIQQLQQQLHQQLEEQKIRQIYQYNFDPSGTASPQTAVEQAMLEGQYPTAEAGQFWTSEGTTTTAPAVVAIEVPQSQAWYTVQSDGLAQYIAQPGIASSVSDAPMNDVGKDDKQVKKWSSSPKLRGQYEEQEENVGEDPRCFKKIVDSGVQTDDEDGAERSYTNRRRRTKKSVDTSVQTDDEDQDDWDLPNRSRRKSRGGKYSDGTPDVDKTKSLSKVSSIAVQTVAEISVQTEPVGTIRTPSIRARVDAKVEIIKHISAPEKTYKGGSLGCQTEADSESLSPQYFRVTSPPKDKKRPTPLEIGYSSHLRAESTTLQVVPSPPKSPKVLYSPISPLSPGKALDSAFVPYEKAITDDISPQKILHPDMAKVSPVSPKSAKMMQRSMSDPKPLSPTAEDSSRGHFQYTEGYLTKGSQTMTPSGTQKKVKRTLPNPPPEETSPGTQSAYSTMGSTSRRRICRTTTMARAKILQDIDRELDLVERESAKLRKKQAELDEEEKEIDAKLRYLEMGINRRKEALLKEREKRERAYLQGVAEERDYMSDSEVSNTRPTRIESQHGLERPRTAPQAEFNQFIPPQTQPEPQLAPPTSPYTQYQFSSPALPTQAPTQFPQPSHYQQQPLYHQPVSPYQTQSTFQTVATMSFTPQTQPPPAPQPSYQLPSQMMVIQQKPRQTTLYLEPKITSNYEVIRNQPLMIAPVSTDNTYAVSHLGSKYNSLDLRIGLEERGSMASSPISSISADSFYADIEHHTPRNYVLIDDIGELTKGTAALSTAFSLHDKDLTKTDRLLRSTEARRTQEVSDFLAPLPTSSRLHTYVKAEEDPMEDPYELKLLKHQIKQEFRRGAESLDHLAGISQYYHADTSYRHFPKSEKYSIGRLTLEKQAAKQLPAAILYQKQAKHKKSLIDPKISKFSPIQESRDLEPDYSSYMTSSTSSIGSLSSRARLLQDDITFGLRKNISEQQKFGAGLGTLGTPMRAALQEEADKPYTSGSRSRPSSRPSSVYGLDLSLKRDPSSSSLRLKAQEAEALEVSLSHAAPSGRAKPTSLPISQSRGRIPIVAQNSEEESPLSPVGQPMGMARAAAGPLPPISADTRDQFGSSHSLPEVQQHMREESRTRGYDRDIAFIMDDFQHAMSDSEAYHLRREETDWFDKPREPRLENGQGLDRKLPERLVHSRPLSQHQEQMNGKPIHYIFPHARIKLLRDPKDHTISGNGLGIRIVGGKEIPGNNGEIGAYIAKILPGSSAEQTGKLMEGMQVLEWNGIPLTSKTYEEVQCIINQQSREAEICVRLDLNMLSDSEYPQNLELHESPKAGLPLKSMKVSHNEDLCEGAKGNKVDKAKSPGVDPKQLAAELQKVSLQQSPLVVSSVVEKGSHGHSGPASAASSAVPSPGQPASPSVSKKRHSSKPADATKSTTHPITGEIQLQINYDKHLGNLIIHILQARNLVPRDNNGYSDPFVKVYLLPGRGQVMVVQNASAEYKRRTKYVQKSLNPEWNQTVIYKNISMEQLKKKTLEVTVWDYDRFSSNDFLGEVLIELSSTSHLDNSPRWYTLKEQTESIDHGKAHSSQSSQQSPKPSVIKSRSHGIFPDPSKDMQVPTIEKSHSSPGSSKSSSEGHLRSHGPSRSQSKTSVTQTHLEDAGAAIAAAEAAVQQLRLQPTRPTNHRPAESSISTGSSVSSFGSGYSVDSEGSSSTVGDTNLFPIPRIGKMSQNGQEPGKQPGMGLTDVEGKTQVMGEIKIALKKEMKTDGEQLIVEILQCRNITYKFKSPDHLPDLYVKLYVINISSQKRVIKKKTRVCRHDREPSFNETFRFSLSPAGHSLQILLVSNGGKFMKKTLIGEAYIWLDKIDLRKRIVNWHKLLASPTQTH
ncbi:protein piccolo [Ornithorhynchus anatinus]|uniref:protein piccolo n=1 Tax=Ornithorhynchus anatinus TaxID=9258 RepID=UPI0010A92659|nr:protein piccolo [Ornithorhynchus anatinus]